MKTPATFYNHGGIIEIIKFILINDTMNVRFKVSTLHCLNLSVYFITYHIYLNERVRVYLID